MKKATNYLRGTLRLEAVGPYPERFINICSANGIPFWGVERVDDTTLRVTVPLSRGKRAVALGEKALCRVEVVGRSGAPERLRSFRRRWGMMAGVVLSLLAVLVLSRFVLVIDITGDTDIPKGVLLAELAQAGLYPGVYGPAVDERAISNRMLLAVEELGFLSVNLQGVRAQVVVRDALPRPEVEPTDQSRDLVAAKGGRVLELLDLAGAARVAVGDTVAAGDTLISGAVTVTNADGSQVLSDYRVYAKGEVWAQVEEVFSAAIPLSCLGKDYTGRSDRVWELVILGKSFKISPKTFQPFAYYDKIEVTHTITLANGLTLPFALIQRRAEEYRPVDQRLEADHAEQYLRQVLEQRLEAVLGEGGSVLFRQWSVARENGALTVTLTAQCREQIAQGRMEEDTITGQAPYGDERFD